MPWSHCKLEFILDTEDCPQCGTSKAAWTIELDKTRVDTGKTLTCRSSSQEEKLASQVSGMDIGGGETGAAPPRGLAASRPAPDCPGLGPPP